jgi:hypothetical protein
MNRISKKQKNRILKSLGIETPSKTDINKRIEEGKNKHRKFVQDIKNEEIRKNRSSGTLVNNKEDLLLMNKESPEYSNFQDLLSRRNWREITENGE